MRGRHDEITVRRSVYLRDNDQHLDILSGIDALFIRLAIGVLRPGERILDAFAYHADYLDVTNPFRPHPRIRPALLCLTGTRLIEVYAAKGGLSPLPSPAWVVRHVGDVEYAAIDLREVATVCTRRSMRPLGVAHDVVVELRDDEQRRIGSHPTQGRAEIIADRIRHRAAALRAVRGS